MDCRELAQKLVRLCRKKGADHAEALVVNQREKAITAFNGQVQLSGASDVTRFTVRLFRNHAGAIAVGRGYYERALEQIVETAVASAYNSSPNKNLGPADPDDLGRLSNDLGIFDQRLDDISFDAMRDLALTAESTLAAKDPRAAQLITSTLQVQTQTVALCISQGFNESYKATMATLHMSAVMDDYYNDLGARSSQIEETKLAGTSSGVARSLDGLSIDETAARTVEHLSTLSGARLSPRGWFPVVFSPLAARRVAMLMLQLCSGPAASLLSSTRLGKIDDRFCSPLITLVDDATHEGGVRTVPFDHEGVRPRRKTIIEQGILREYLLNSYYGRLLQRRSTGNAMANEDVRFTVRPSNAYIEPGNATHASIIGDIRQGFYVTQILSPAAHLSPSAANLAQAVAGIWIENGRLAYPVRAATLSAPLEDMLENIVAVSSDGDSNAPVSSPTLMVSKMSVSPLM
jgi:PmbA protein